MPARITVRVEGFREIQRKLRGNELYAGPFREAMESIGEAGEAAVRTRAPVASGRMFAKIRHRVNARSLPRWVAFRAPATRTSARYKRYPYPKRLEYDPRSPHRGWMRAAVESIGGRVNAALSEASRKIEWRWR